MKNRDKQNEKNSLVIGWEFAYQNDRPCIVITEQIGNEIYILGSFFESAGNIELQGYRKSTDVAEEIFAEIEKLRPITKLVIKDLGEWDFDKYGEKFYWLSETKIAELKKKYTEDK